MKAFSFAGLRILHMEKGEKIPAPWNSEHRIEHFGFRDGISQPFVDVDLGAPRPPPAGGGTARPGGTWDPIAPGELLLGFRDEDGFVQQRPRHEKLRNAGTYLVFRKLEQDVAGFRRYLKEHGSTAGPELLLAAQMMGRWPNGTSLVDAPAWPPEERSDDTVNDYRYRDQDPRGLRCPLGSHARRVNPRDSNDRDEARRHRIWRRSLTYGGDFLPYDLPGDGKSRGLLFVSLCARIDQQFEFLQTRWVNGAEFIGQAGIGRCPVAGANTGDIEGNFAVPGRPAPHTHVPRFVKVLGGDYFFVPSLAALEDIVNGEKFGMPPETVPKNPSLDQTPKLLDKERLAEEAGKLLADLSPPFAKLGPRILVARQQHVRTILDDDRRFSLADLDRRIRQMCGGERLMLGLPNGDADRDVRLRLWRDAARMRVGPSPAEIARRAMKAILDRHGPTGRLDVVRQVSLVAPMAVVQYYMGVAGPDWLSPSYAASQFNKLEIAQVPPWLSTLPRVQPQDVPFTTMQAWAQTAFAHVFTNFVNAAELGELAERTTAEFFRHLDGLIARTRPLAGQKATLLQCMLSLDPAAYGLPPDRFAEIVRLILAELIVGSTGTLAQALPNFVDFFAAHRNIVDPARSYTDAELDAIIREALRFEPVAPVLFRRCTQDAEVGGETIPAGSFVVLLLQAAMSDPCSFHDPGTFSTDPAIRRREDYLIFGAGLHECKGMDIATDVMREMVRPLVTFKDLRIAAGPAASKRDPLDRRTKLAVRFEPLRTS